MTMTNPPSVYPPGVDQGKFSPDGNPLPFAGNTIVAHLSPTSPLYTSLLSLHDKLSKSHLSHLYTLLPPESWHMTIFEGVCDQVRRPEFWPTDLPLDAPLDAVTAHFTSKLTSFNLRANRPPYLMRVDGMDPLEVGIGIHLEARTAEEGRRIRGLRDRLAGELDMRHPGHKKYGLHFSVAYLLRRLSDEQEREVRELVLGCLEGVDKDFELGAPEFCTFGDMFAFQRLFYLGEGQ